MLLYITSVGRRPGDHRVSYPDSQQLNYPLLSYQLLQQQLRHRLRLPQANATPMSHSSCADTAFFLPITRRFHLVHDPFEFRRLVDVMSYLHSSLAATVLEYLGLPVQKQDL